MLLYHVPYAVTGFLFHAILMLN